MYHFVKALSAPVIAAVLISGTAFMPSHAETATAAGALKEATVACKVIVSPASGDGKAEELSTNGAELSATVERMPAAIARN